MDEQQKLAPNDHRRLGQELDLFVFSDLVGSGLPLFTPRGTVLREELFKLSTEIQKKRGYQAVSIPHITKVDLYKKSGHWDKFGEELFLIKSQETKDEMVLKPMNCPHHIQIFASKPRSYRDLPVRYMENTIQYRDDKKGELMGLARVRAISIDDSHVFCNMEQIEQEFVLILDMIKEWYKVLQMDFRAILAFRDDSEKYLGDKSDWAKAEKIIEDVAKKSGLKYEIVKGEAAFYGPKIDIMVTDSLGREWQCATEQLDLVMPKRFELSYTAKDGSEQPVVMIHKALLGSVERFLAVYLEHTGGKFPVWLAPEQVRIITINDHPDTLRVADFIVQIATEMGLRVQIDASNETVGKKVAKAESMKVPHKLFVGNDEVEANREYLNAGIDSKEIDKSSPYEFMSKVKIESDDRTNHPEFWPQEKAKS